MAHSKTDLPSKLCAACHRPFAWRKRWRDCWSEVRYCSERCRRSGRNRTVVKSAAAAFTPPFTAEGEQA